jgi:predicted phosphoribosyltransferase
VTRVFADRREAGRELAQLLNLSAGHDDPIVLALPRGGVPVAFEVASALPAPLDVFVVRKLGVPRHRELAMGAIASGEVIVLNDEVVRGLGIGPAVIDRVVAEERAELRRRERAYRGDRPPLELAKRSVILVDDGIATGSSMLAAVEALRSRGPARIVVAVPIAAQSALAELRARVDDVVCAVGLEPFFAIGQLYRDFTQTSDEEVQRLLATAPPR